MQDTTSIIYLPRRQGSEFGYALFDDILNTCFSLRAHFGLLRPAALSRRSSEINLRPALQYCQPHLLVRALPMAQ